MLWAAQRLVVMSLWARRRNDHSSSMCGCRKALAGRLRLSGMSPYNVKVKDSEHLDTALSYTVYTLDVSNFGSLMSHVVCLLDISVVLMTVMC